ncbi:hypothetical protein MTO96_027183 [Rhipicephalus appendiculatus]
MRGAPTAGVKIRNTPRIPSCRRRTVKHTRQRRPQPAQRLARSVFGASWFSFFFARERSERGGDGRPARTAAEQGGAEAPIPEEWDRWYAKARAPVHKSTRNQWKPRRRCTAKGHQRSGTPVIRTGRDFLKRTFRSRKLSRKQILRSQYGGLFFCHTVLSEQSKNTASLGPRGDDSDYDEAKSDPSDDTIRSQAASIPRHSLTHTQHTPPVEATSTTAKTTARHDGCAGRRLAEPKAKRGWRGRRSRSGACREK